MKPTPGASAPRRSFHPPLERAYDAGHEKQRADALADERRCREFLLEDHAARVDEPTALICPETKVSRRIWPRLRIAALVASLEARSRERE
jgi:hypothetical protein